MTAIFIFKCTEGAGVGDYSWGGGVGGKLGEKNIFLASSQTALCPLSSFDTHARCSPTRKALGLEDLSEK